MIKHTSLLLVLVSVLSSCSPTPVQPVPDTETTTEQASLQAAPLGNGQTLSFRFARGEAQQISGELTIASADASTQQFTRALQVGTYAMQGSFQAPRGFSLQGDFGAPLGSFAVSGMFPTQTEAGSATLTVNGESITVVIPALQDIPKINPTPQPSLAPVMPQASATPLADKQWTVEELRLIETCFFASVRPKEATSVRPAARLSSRLNAYTSTAFKDSVSAERLQALLNTLGTEATADNAEFGFNCIK